VAIIFKLSDVAGSQPRNFFLSVCRSVYLSIYLPLSLYLYLPIYGFTVLCWALAACQFLNLYTGVRAPRTGDQPVARSLPAHRTTQTQNKRTQTYMPPVGFEPTVLVYKLAKTVYALGGPYTYESGLRVRLGEESGSD
jgi:hypothetical protein